MKTGPDQRTHLTYCTNIHPGESWPEVLTNLQYYLPALKSRLAPDRPFGIGLRLSDAATRDLQHPETLEQFQAWLDQQDLYVFTLNGFPYGGFHHQVVKDQVYAPDWSRQERLDYTLRLAHLLSVLLPAGMEGGISTVPISYKPWFADHPSGLAAVCKTASLQLAQVVAEMIRLQEETGKRLHLDLEPEPDGLLENTTEVIEFFQNWLLPVGGAFLSKVLDTTPEAAEALLLDYVRLCYDTCHFAVAYEDPDLAFQRLRAAGIQVGKVQLSAALKVAIPQDQQARQQLRDRLQPFAESTYLHQVVAQRPDLTLFHYPDLHLALADIAHTGAQEWRIHFHVPLFVEDYQGLQSTQSDLVRVLKLLPGYPACRHLEIETYTWDVLPADLQVNLLSSIQREYEWVLSHSLERV